MRFSHPAAAGFALNVLFAAISLDECAALTIDPGVASEWTRYESRMRPWWSAWEPIEMLGSVFTKFRPADLPDSWKKKRAGVRSILTETERNELAVKRSRFSRVRLDVGGTRLGYLDIALDWRFIIGRNWVGSALDDRAPAPVAPFEWPRLSRSPGGGGGSPPAAPTLRSLRSRAMLVLEMDGR